MKHTLKELKELYLLLFSMGVITMLMLFCMVMIAFHPGQEKMNASEKTLWITILSNLAFLVVKSPLALGDGKKESQIAIDSQETNVLAQENFNEKTDTRQGK